MTEEWKFPDPEFYVGPKPTTIDVCKQIVALGRAYDKAETDLAAVRKELAGLREAVEWYEERARQLGTKQKRAGQHVAVLTELEMDAGKCAKAALARLDGGGG